ncbi:hypothetical protein CK203_038067 [Vitis vinifera]|uniref:Uncharacterized protein n=1 Tax=Vitis vinifera TaxID=29760 RepID=A0A438H9Z7_VITVI|nr:hypothetical protein CK203_038067 [Vitis vinifera]
MGTDVQLSKRIISFWLWLEAEGYDDMVKQLCCHDDHELLAPACAEAEVALAFLSTLICFSPILRISFRSLLGFLGVCHDPNSG